VIFAGRASRVAAAALALGLLCAARASAQATTDRFSAGGYYRIMTRPDFQGGNSKLGLWNLYGRLLNEGPYGMLQLQLNVLQSDPQQLQPWARVNARIEGGSFANSDPGRGALSNFAVSQLYVQAGNILLDGVTWQLGTLDFYPGDLGLYDFRPADLFFDTVGLSAFYRGKDLDLLIGVGDSGYSLRGFQYDTLFTTGAWARYRFSPHFELGLGGQFIFEPGIEGNRFAPYSTPGVRYEDFVRHEVVKHYLDENPGKEDLFPKPLGSSSQSWKLVGYLGFGKLGPLRWSNLFANLQRRHPDNFYAETYQGRNYTIYTHDLTDQRYGAQAGNEMMITLIPDRLEAAWGVLIGKDWNGRNTIAAGEDNRLYISSVLRLQVYATQAIHFLAEGSVAQEKSLNGNLWREHVDSIFASTNGVADARGLELGDSDVRNTVQGKIGVLFSPAGRGIWARPALRVLYGLQYSNMQNAFGNNFESSLDQYNQFASSERHWHSVVAVEAEGWF
jgi:hypothetical protein